MLPTAFELFETWVFEIILIDLWFSSDLWLSISKERILVISSPKNSIRKGVWLEYGKISKIPPLTANSPGSITKSSLLKSNSNNCSFRLSNEIFSPTFNLIEIFFSSCLLIWFSEIALTYVTIMELFFLEKFRCSINSVLCNKL